MENYVLRAIIGDESRGGKPGSPIPFIAATEGLKDDGLDLVMSGIQLERYLANPIFTWAHDLFGHRLPIGRVIDILIDGSKLRVKVEFDQEDEFARQVESKYRRGFLNAVSITWNTKEREGSKVLAWEPIEIAAVPVPMDPDAMMEAERAGLQNLQRSLNNLFADSSDEESNGEPDGSLEEDDALGRESEGEAVFLGVAVQMVRLFRGVDEFPDDERQAIYKKLARQYAELGKEPPEYLPLARIRALGTEEVRGLFLENEFEMLSGELLPPVFPEEDADPDDPAGVSDETPNGESDDSPTELEETVRAIHGLLVDPETEPETVDPRIVEIHKKLIQTED